MNNNLYYTGISRNGCDLSDQTLRVLVLVLPIFHNSIQFDCTLNSARKITNIVHYSSAYFSFYNHNFENWALNPTENVLSL